MSRKEIDYADMIELDFEGIDVLPPLDRRQFLKLLGGGIVVFASCKETEKTGEKPRKSVRPTTSGDFNTFLRIGEDGRVTCFTGKIEMGQGVVTSLPQTLADELDVPLDAIDMVMGDTDLCPWDMGTFGSMSTRFFGPMLRAAAAKARTVLIDLAAEKLAVPVKNLAAEGGFVFQKNKPTHRVSYGELSRGKALLHQVQVKPALKSSTEFKLVGKPVLRLDALEKVTGKALYTGDIRLPGMLYARILRPPAHGARLLEVDTSAAEATTGVKVVRDGDLVAVLHEDPEVAGRALGKVKARFETKEATLDNDNIFEHLVKVAPEGKVLASGGDIEAGRRSAEHVFEETYLNAYVAHAPIEPHTALAQVKDGKATVWASTQTPFMAKNSVAGALGMKDKNVRIITPFVGGGFGGKGKNYQADEAAKIAKTTGGKPVQVMWSRAEEFFMDTFRPAAVVKINSGLGKTGKIAFWDYKVFFAGSRGATHLYDFANHREIATGTSMMGGWKGTPGSHPFETGAWRAPAANTNVFARESQIDIMAARAGVDPLEFRLGHLTDKRMIRVLRAVADKFGWKPAKGPSGRGFGIACAEDAGTYVAHMAEVEVDKKTGRVWVKRVVCAQDMGLVVNPEGARLQVEGCITMGLGYALSEEIRFKGGEILDKNFDTYEIPRFSLLPEIETVFVETGNMPPQGGGEPAIVCMGGLIANAVFDAVGARLFHLPMTPERVLAALA